MNFEKTEKIIKTLKKLNKEANRVQNVLIDRDWDYGSNYGGNITDGSEDAIKNIEEFIENKLEEAFDDTLSRLNSALKESMLASKGDIQLSDGRYEKVSRNNARMAKTDVKLIKESIGKVKTIKVERFYK